MPRKKKDLSEQQEKLIETELPASEESNVSIIVQDDIPPPQDNDSSSSADTDDNELSHDIESLLRNIQSNCSVMSKQHKKRYLMLKGKLIYFRIPLIILGSANSVFAVGLTQYLPQQNVSVINCMLSLTCTIITSIELFLGIQSGMEKELVAQREFYLMAVDLYSCLSLKREHRTGNGKRYLEKILSQYNKLIEQSEVVRAKITDKLLPVITPLDDPEIGSISNNNL